MEDSIKSQIVEAKRQLRRDKDRLRTAFHELDDAMKAEADKIQATVAAGRPCIPELDYAAIRNGAVSDDTRAEIRQRGAVVIRGVFERARTEDWNEELSNYITENGYYEKEVEKRGLDKYFSGLASGRPQIFGIYWSKPQVMIRQSETMADTKRFLNRLWQVDGPGGQEFDPDNDYTYADRTRRREPGDKTLGLSPHMDSGSYERWTDPAFQKIYQSVFAGDWRSYDPWNASQRTKTKEFPSPAVCSMFRTFQGWTGLTPQGPNDGTLQLVPIANGIAYMLLRALQDDVFEDDLCGALPGRALGASREWHPSLMEGLVSIPTVEPGDTVWWHPDIIHAVEDEHHGAGYSNVVYVGASPRCEKNAVYARLQAQAFLEGRSAPDFAPEDYEIDFNGRATLDDLTDLGRAQMGL
ncbi:YbiU family protein [Pelagibius sp. Alg239-R121]|uniref:YbiU family protein n=1 Tax=Pelagibius sp. Alg239-R121 TaxID=2993448 RepID=UPI0024A77AAD|nr:YbiU family protein [Pelagibius sp. Alg239-R121]